MVTRFQSAIRDEGAIDVTGLTDQARFKTAKGFRLVVIPNRNKFDQNEINLALARARRTGVLPSEIFRGIFRVSNVGAFVPKLGPQRLAPASVRGLRKAGIIEPKFPTRAGIAVKPKPETPAQKSSRLAAERRFFGRPKSAGKLRAEELQRARDFFKRRGGPLAIERIPLPSKIIRRVPLRISDFAGVFAPRLLTGKEIIDFSNRLELEGKILDKRIANFTASEAEIVNFNRISEAFRIKANKQISKLEASQLRRFFKDEPSPVKPEKITKQQIQGFIGDLTVGEVIPKELGGKGVSFIKSAKEFGQTLVDFNKQFGGTPTFKAKFTRREDTIRGIGNILGAAFAGFETLRQGTVFAVQEGIKISPLKRGIKVFASQKLINRVRGLGKAEVPLITNPLKFIKVGKDSFVLTPRAAGELAGFAFEVVLIFENIGRTGGKVASVHKIGKGGRPGLELGKIKFTNNIPKISDFAKVKVKTLNKLSTAIKNIPEVKALKLRIKFELSKLEKAKVKVDKKPSKLKSVIQRIKVEKELKKIQLKKALEPLERQIIVLTNLQKQATQPFKKLVNDELFLLKKRRDNIRGLFKLKKRITNKTVKEFTQFARERKNIFIRKIIARARKIGLPVTSRTKNIKLIITEKKLKLKLKVRGIKKKIKTKILGKKEIIKRGDIFKRRELLRIRIRQIRRRFTNFEKRLLSFFNNLGSPVRRALQPTWLKIIERIRLLRRKLIRKILGKEILAARANKQLFKEMDAAEELLKKRGFELFRAKIRRRNAKNQARFDRIRKEEQRIALKTIEDYEKFERKAFRTTDVKKPKTSVSDAIDIKNFKKKDLYSFKEFKSQDVSKAGKFNRTRTGLLQIQRTKTQPKVRTKTKSQLKRLNKAKRTFLKEIKKVEKRAKSKVQLKRSILALREFKLKQKVKVRQRLLVKQRLKVLQKQRVIQKQKFKERQKLKVRQALALKSKLSTTQKLALKQRLALRLRQRLALRTKLRTRLALKTRLKTRQKIISKTILLPITLPVPSISVKSIARLKGPFNIIVRRRGKRVKINKFPLSGRQALAFGGNFADNNAVRSFAIVKTKGKIRKVKFPAFKIKKFRRPKGNTKLQKFFLVEKTRFAIDTKGEKRQITAKGLAALRRRKRKVKKKQLNRRRTVKFKRTVKKRRVVGRAKKKKKR